MPEKLAPNLLSWASILDDKTREQAIVTSNMPFVRPHLALMPDAHHGLGSTVGSVLPTVGAIMPAAVGVDIGCGMIALRTPFTRETIGDRDALREIRERIEKAIPLSVGRQNAKLDRHAEASLAYLEQRANAYNVDPDIYSDRWALQLGTLGSGNHFIELSADEEDRIWIFLHSGSRGVGNQIAKHWIAVAEEYDRRHFIDLPHRDLAYLVEGTGEFNDYIDAMRWAQEYAEQNRMVMLNRVVDILEELVAPFGAAGDGGLIQCHHNYTTHERHMGQDVWLSRKGAIDAAAGKLGLIPGSMGDLSYVVRGKGDVPSFHSAPHGAGRVLARGVAKRTLDEATLVAEMDGIEWNAAKAKEFIDESPAAYKPIDVVMEDAMPLVEIVHTLRQILNVKGD